MEALTSCSYIISITGIIVYIIAFLIYISSDFKNSKYNIHDISENFLSIIASSLVTISFVAIMKILYDTAHRNYYLYTDAEKVDFNRLIIIGLIATLILIWLIFKDAIRYAIRKHRKKKRENKTSKNK